MDISKYFLTCPEDEMETLDSLLHSNYPIGLFNEDDQYYYIMQDVGDPYDNTMWAIDKKTGESHCIDFIDFMFDILEHTTIVNPPYDRIKIGD